MSTIIIVTIFAAEFKNCVKNIRKILRTNSNKNMSSKEYKELTPAELSVMRILWDKKQALARDVLNEMPEPKPAYNTVSTVIRVLEKKGFVGHKAYGTTYEYYPLVLKREYTSNFLQSMMHNLFGGSKAAFMSFFAEEESMTEEEISELEQLMQKVEERKRNENEGC